MASTDFTNDQNTIHIVIWDIKFTCLPVPALVTWPLLDCPHVMLM